MTAPLFNAVADFVARDAKREAGWAQADVLAALRKTRDDFEAVYVANVLAREQAGLPPRHANDP